MRPSFPTTSPVAAATARILAAYLSNHKLSPAEAASLSGRIVDALVSLASGAGVMSETPPARAEQPAAKRRAKPREAGTAATEGRVPPEPVASIPEPEAEPAAQPMVEPAALAEGEPEDRPVPAAQPIQAAPPEAVGPADLPRKRKRPSRPRSKRGQGAGAAPDSGAMSAEQPKDDAAHRAAAENEVIAAAGETEVASAPVDAEVGAEGPALAPKPRRAASRARRVASP